MLPACVIPAAHGPPEIQFIVAVAAAAAAGRWRQQQPSCEQQEQEPQQDRLVPCRLSPCVNLCVESECRVPAPPSASLY